MFYKEWLSVRQKLLLMVVLYSAAGVLVGTFWSADYYDNIHPLFRTWLIAAMFVTGGVAILGGVDVIAEETDKGTIGFLLTQPLSRARIYLSKLALNGAAIAVTLIPSSLIMFFVDHIPRSHVIYTYTSNGCYTTSNVVGTVPVPTIGLRDTLIGIIAILTTGILVLCLSALISVFARNTIQGIVWTILSMATLYTLLFYINANFIRTTIDFDDFTQLSLLPFIIPLIFIFFVLGLQSFKRKEF